MRYVVTAGTTVEFGVCADEITGVEERVIGQVQAFRPAVSGQYAEAVRHALLHRDCQGIETGSGDILAHRQGLIVLPERTPLVKSQTVVVHRERWVIDARIRLHGTE